MYTHIYTSFALSAIHQKSRALRDGHFDFGRDRDGMDPKTAVSGRDWSGWDFLGIVLGFFGIFRDYKILFFFFGFCACYLL
jgi:hypothetical protein